MIVRALCFEAERNNVQRCKALLADGADVNGSFSMGFRPLFYAAMAGGDMPPPHASSALRQGRWPPGLRSPRRGDGRD